ncbi:ArnT family glycosyltransferase [Nocardia mangyaensis]|uniref:ArnT family glycosyltransferase n=1 Tax=Nocardia mangyaensis TaxID=2213200 RepID=UPI0026765B80|nr:glycosyltransferase family 39 protein [Nocardia mangyaensis]MDO3646801.1 glycosyltransferase family 39 protein [Nocardia mangyaensis]
MPEAVEIIAVETPARFAWRPVGVVAVVAGGLFLSRLGRYEFGGDELYFIAAGRQLALGHADQGPVVPLLAALADVLAPGSRELLRLPALVATVASILLAAAIAREFGGGARAQTIAAICYACTPAAVMQAAMASTYALDAALTAGISWLFIRWVRTRADWLLVLAGVLAAVDFQVKWLAPMVWAGLAVGIAVFGPLALLGSRGWWYGSAVLVVAAVPTLVWQQRNGWPQVAMGAVVRAEQLATSGGLVAMPWQVVMVTGPVGALALVGIWAGLRAQRLRPYRFLIPIVVLGLGAVVVGGLRPYFVVGALPGLFAAGAVFVVDRPWRPALVRGGAVLTACSALLAAAFVLVLPLPGHRLQTPTDRYDQIDTRSKLFGPTGWSTLIDGVTTATHQIPATERSSLAIVTENYWQAAALETLGRDRGLPPVFSPNRGYGYFGAPDDDTTAILYVGLTVPHQTMSEVLTHCTPVHRIDDRLGYPGVNRNVTVWRCATTRQPWSTAWPSLRTLPLFDGTT